MFSSNCAISFMPSKSQGRTHYLTGTLMSAQPGYASLCKKCGQCDNHCPQSIPIRTSLSEVKKTLDNIGFRAMAFITPLLVRKK